MSAMQCSRSQYIPKLVDQLLSLSLLRFLKTGADHHALSFDDDLGTFHHFVYYFYS